MAQASLGLMARAIDAAFSAWSYLVLWCVCEREVPLAISLGIVTEGSR